MTETMDRRDVLGAAAVVAAASVIASEAAAQAPAGRMTVHILDLFSGTPANGVKVELFTKNGDAMKPVKSVTTGAGRPPDHRPAAAGRGLHGRPLPDRVRSVRLLQGPRQVAAGELLPQGVHGVRGHRREDAASHPAAMHALDAGVLGATGLTHLLAAEIAARMLLEATLGRSCGRAQWVIGEAAQQGC